MNKQDKKEIMNLIKYKKMLGGRRMSLEKMSIDEAEIWLGQVVKGGLADKETIKAINVVLDGLDIRYNKGYQDGFKQAKFDCEMDKLDGR